MCVVIINEIEYFPPKLARPKRSKFTSWSTDSVSSKRIMRKSPSSKEFAEAQVDILCICITRHGALLLCLIRDEWLKKKMKAIIIQMLFFIDCVYLNWWWIISELFHVICSWVCVWRTLGNCTTTTWRPTVWVSHSSLLYYSNNPEFCISDVLVLIAVCHVSFPLTFRQNIQSLEPGGFVWNLLFSMVMLSVNQHIAIDWPFTNWRGDWNLIYNLMSNYSHECLWDW